MSLGPTESVERSFFWDSSKGMLRCTKKAGLASLGSGKGARDCSNPVFWDWGKLCGSSTKDPRLWCHSHKMAVVPCTSHVLENNVGNYPGLFIWHLLVC